MRRTLISGDASAYLINRRGAKKVLAHRLVFPVYPDVLVNFVCRVYTVTASYPTLAQTWETTTLHRSRYGNSVTLNMSVVKLGPTNIVLGFGDVLGLVACLVVVCLATNRPKKKK